MNPILLNEKLYTISETNLPCLVVYGEGMGGSHLSIVLAAQLFAQGSKILFLTAYPMARDKFLEQIGDDHSSIAFVDSVANIEKSKDSQVIILESGNEKLFLESIKILEDLDERMVLVKNIEKFSTEVFDNCLNLEKVILSGNIDDCVAKDEISRKFYNTIIAFHQPNSPLPIKVPELPKWSGYLKDGSQEGIIKILKN